MYDIRTVRNSDILGRGVELHYAGGCIYHLDISSHVGEMGIELS
jgi:hypothetical protein